MKEKRVLYLVQAAMIAAIYVVLTFISNLMGLASGTIQVRLSEALCVLPIFTSAGIPGLAIGCFLANLLTGCILPDVLCGSLATLLGAVGTYLLRKRRYLCFWPPVICNMILVPLVLRYAYGLQAVYKGVDWSLPFFALTVGIGEVISCVLIGGIFRKVLTKYKVELFG